MDNLFSVNTIITIFIILFPGIIIKKAFYSNKFSTQFYKGQFSDRIITTLLLGIFNLICAAIITPIILKYLFGISCVSCTLQNLISNFSKANLENNGYFLHIVSFENSFYFLSLSIFSLIILPFFIGKFSFRVIRRLGFDLRFSYLTFSNHWHYFFTGEIMNKKVGHGKIIDKKNLSFRTNKNNVTVLDVLTEEGDKKYLYKGILLDYNLKDGTEDLDSVVLINPKKKNYDKDRSEENGSPTRLDFEDIPGDFILIPYNNIINLNVNIKPVERRLKIVQQESTEPISTEAAKLDGSTRKGCLILIAYFIIILISSVLANGISYLKFTLGLFLTLMLVTPVFFMIDDLVKKVRTRTLFFLILYTSLLYHIYIKIFHIDLFSPWQIAIDFFKSL